MAFKASPQQAAFFNWIKKGKGNAFINAVAGSGKSTSLVEGARFMKGEIAMVAFNKKIADELYQKIAKNGVKNAVSGTFHSFGLRAWKNYLKKNYYPRDFVNSYKIANIIREVCSEKEEELYSSFVRQIVSLAKQTGVGFAGFPAINNDGIWYELVNHFDLESDLEKGAIIERAISIAQEVLEKSNEMGRDVIDFDDMIYLPVLKGIQMEKTFDWVLVDESQDTNPARRAMAAAMMKPKARIVFVGDKCQPEGTIVQTPTGTINIEELKVGDLVVSFSNKEGSFVQKGRRVNGITKRPYKGTLVTIESNGKVSSYTPNHFVNVNMSAIADKFVVYLMEKNGKFRIGVTRFRNRTTKQSGFMTRFRQEKADNVWLLSLHDVKKDALLEEMKISHKFGIPQITFSPVNAGSVWNQELLSSFWNVVENRDSAINCLNHYNKMIEYPMNELITTMGQFRITRPVKIRAINMFDEMTVLHYEGNAHFGTKNYHPIKVSFNDWKGTVVSLNVEKDHSYVADSIATYNCQAIYGFTGADSNAVEIISNEFNCAQLPLTVTYRCPKNVVKASQAYVSHITAHESAKDGEVVSVTREAFADDYKALTAADAILCRKTAPLVKEAYTLIRKGVACKVEGRDIGRGLNELVTKWKISSVEKFLEKLGDWEEKTAAKFLEKKKEMAASALHDKCDTVRVLCEGCRTIKEVSDKINSLFGDSDDEVKYNKVPKLTLSTVHKAKGREWNNVYVLGFDEYMPSPMAKQDWEREQEKNLIYVAFTRAMNKLTLVG